MTQILRWALKLLSSNTNNNASEKVVHCTCFKCNCSKSDCKITYDFLKYRFFQFSRKFLLLFILFLSYNPTNMRTVMKTPDIHLTIEFFLSSRPNKSEKSHWVFLYFSFHSIWSSHSVVFNRSHSSWKGYFPAESTRLLQLRKFSETWFVKDFSQMVIFAAVADKVVWRI